MTEGLESSGWQVPQVDSRSMGVLPLKNNSS